MKGPKDLTEFERRLMELVELYRYQNAFQSDAQDKFLKSYHQLVIERDR